MFASVPYAIGIALISFCPLFSVFIYSSRSLNPKDVLNFTTLLPTYYIPTLLEKNYKINKKKKKITP